MIIFSSASYSKAKIYDDLQQFLEDLHKKSNDIKIAGDFDIDWQSDFYRSKLECMNDKVLKQIKKEFIRITKNSKTLIYNHK